MIPLATVLVQCQAQLVLAQRRCQEQPGDAQWQRVVEDMAAFVATLSRMQAQDVHNVEEKTPRCLDCGTTENLLARQPYCRRCY